MKKFVIASALAAGTLMASPSFAAEIVTNCASLGIDDIVPNAEACVGYYDKNVLKTSAGNFASADEVAALSLLGLSGPSR